MKKKNLFLIVTLCVLVIFAFILYDFAQIAYANPDGNLKQNTVTNLINEQDEHDLNIKDKEIDGSTDNEQDCSESSDVSAVDDLTDAKTKVLKKSAAGGNLSKYAFKRANLTKGDDVAGIADVKKTVSEQKPDGSYDIRVSITGSIGTKLHPAEVDVIYVVDKSGSMNNYFEHKKSRWDASLDAIDNLNTTLFSDNRIDPRFTIVGFSGDFDGYLNDASVLTDWTSTQSIPHGVRVYGGTNYQAGIMVARQQLQKARPNSKKVIIFLSDGNPTLYYTNFGRTKGYGDQYDPVAMKKAKDELEKIRSIDAFYTVGVGDPDEYINLKKLINSVHEGANTAYYEAIDPDSMQSAFDQMKGEIVNLTMSHVSISDTMSQFGDITSTGDISNTYLEIADEKGNIYKSNESVPGAKEFTLPTIVDGEVIPYKEKAHIYQEGDNVKVSFPAKYELAPGYTYILVSSFRFNEDAFEKFLKGDTSLPTNTDAYVKYYEGDINEYKPGSEKTTHLKPEPETVAVHNNALQLNIEGLTKYPWALGLIEKEADKFKIDIRYPDELTHDSADLSHNDFEKLKDFEYIYQGFQMFNLPIGTEITSLTGTFDIWGFALESQKAILTKDSEKTLVVTNTYKPDLKVINVQKEVEGNGSDVNRPYKFKIELTHNGETPFNSEENFKSYFEKQNSGLVGIDSYKWDSTGIYFEVKPGSDNAVNIVVPNGVDYKISEESLTSEGYTTTAKINDEQVNLDDAEGYLSTTSHTANENQSVVFSNTKDLPAPTLAVFDSTPFTYVCVGGVTLIILMIGISIKKFKN